MKECWRVFLMLLQAILITAQSGLNMFLDILSNNGSRNRHKRSNFNIKLCPSYLIFFGFFILFYFHLILFHYSSFILWASSFLSGPGLSINVLHFCVFGFCFSSCSKDLYFDLEGKEENEERFPFSFKKLLIGDLRASNEPLLPFFAVSFLLIL